MTEEIFPDEGDVIHRGIEQLAQHIGCDASLVDQCMYGLEIAWVSSSHLRRVSDVTHALNDAGRHASNLYKALRRLNADQRADLVSAGCVTIEQIEHLARVLADDVSDLADWKRNRARPGGRNIAAYAVAELVRRVFRRLRRKITFGKTPDGGGPSTEFGRAVEYALGAFSVRASWAGPAQEAYEKQGKIANRMLGCIMRKARTDASNMNQG